MFTICSQVARLICALVFTITLGLAAQAQDFTNAQKQELRSIVKEYILEHPEIIVEALALQEEQAKQAETFARANALTDLKDQIFDSQFQVVLGNPNGSKTIVEFFDYNCGFCKRAHEDMIRLIEADSDLRVVLKEFPVLGQGSVEAARVSIAVNSIAPEKFMEFHTQLLLAPGAANQAKAMRVADQLGIGLFPLEEALGSDLSAQTIQSSYQIADALGLTGTPSYVVGKQIVFGAVGYDQLKAAIDKSEAN